MMKEEGFKIIQNFLSGKDFEDFFLAIDRIHKKWTEINSENLKKYNLINSAYLTHPSVADNQDRMTLFELIASDKIQNELNHIFGNRDARFLNTQLFFDPLDASKKNYWHRDIQYTDMDEEDQKNVILNPEENVVHFRIALNPQSAIELIPGTHKRWDTDEEYKVRKELKGRHSYDDLSNSKLIALDTGDLLIFSANMLHRGHYGGNRKAFDILYCQPDPAILQFRDEKCLPCKLERKQLLLKSLF